MSLVVVGGIGDVFLLSEWFGKKCHHVKLITAGTSKSTQAQLLE